MTFISNIFEDLLSMSNKSIAFNIYIHQCQQMDTQKKAPCIFTLTYIRALTAIQSNNQDLTRLDQKSHKTHVHHIMLKY